VHLAFGPIYGPEGSLLERVERFRTSDGRRIATHVVPHLVREVNPWADWRCAAELKRLIREIGPDIVHTHSSKAGIVGRAAAWDVNGEGSKAGATGRARCGVIHTIHGPPFMPLDGSVLGRLKVRANNATYQAAERYAAKRCHVIVSVADAMTEQFLRRGIGEPSQYCTVYSGMETQCFLTPRPGETRDEVRARLGIGERDLVVGTVARLAQHKGHDDLLDALGEDLRRRRDWKLLWVGDGWWRERLLRRVREMGLEKQVLTTGLVPPESVPGLMRAMDILAHPSSREGLPRTVPQALLCGVVPVAYDVDGTREICRDMETGRLVEAGSVRGLRSAVEWLAERPDARQTMAERGREECVTKFSADRMVEELQRVYERALMMARGKGQGSE
jgi:glycosyltransferase involved in cell wall biosynthesis